MTFGDGKINQGQSVWNWAMRDQRDRDSTENVEYQQMRIRKITVESADIASLLQYRDIIALDDYNAYRTRFLLEPSTTWLEKTVFLERGPNMGFFLSGVENKPAVTRYDYVIAAMSLLKSWEASRKILSS